jgi:hypothetical protein
MYLLLIKRLFVVAKIGKLYTGVIHVDDFSFEENAICSLKPSKVADELTSLTPSILTTPTPEQPASNEITCNFDKNNTCGWVNDPRAQVRWTLSKGGYSYKNTGPIADVSGDGFYAFIDSASGKEGAKARLISPNLDSSIIKNTSKID